MIKPYFLKISFIIIIYCISTIKPQSLSYTSYTTKDGLPSNTITTIFQDSKGYIWIGTNNGLARYDGAEFTKYSTSNGLSNNWITTITESPFEPGTIWIGTIAGGVNKWANGSITSYKFGADPDWNLVSDLCIDKTGTVWFTVFNNFLQIVKDSVTIVKDKNSPKHPDKVLSKKDGSIWCAEGNQVYIRKPLTTIWKKFNLELPKTSIITSMTLDAEDQVWIGTSDKLIIELSDSGIVRKEKTKYGIPYKLQDDGHGSLLVRDRDLFFSVSKENLSDQKFLPFPKNEEMPWDVTSPFLFDREGNTWIGTWLKGLLKVSDLSLLHFQFPGTSKLNSANIDQNGNIWVGTNGGIWEVYIDNENQWQKKISFS